MTSRALMIVDLQNDYFPGGKFALPGIGAAAANAARLLDAARASGDLVVHIRHEFPSAEAPFFAPGSEGVEINELVRNREGEPVVVKNHANSFRDTSLRELLESRGVTDLVIAGAMTHMCVDATVRAAADLGYKPTVVHDAVAACDLEFNGVQASAAQVHAAFIAALGFGYATIRSTDEQLGKNAA